MIEDYASNRKFGDKFMPEVKAILGQFLLRDDFADEDRERNTDLIVLKMETQRIGVRIRRHVYYENKNYRNQFTIRFQLASNKNTEFQKIMNGWGDYFFYGFADESEISLQDWFIGYFPAFRDYVTKKMLNSDKNVFADRIMQNNDFKGSSFIWFWKNEIPDFIVADSFDWPYLINTCKISDIMRA